MKDFKAGDIFGGVIGRAQVEFFAVLKATSEFVTLARLGKTEKMIDGGMVEVAPVVPSKLTGLRGRRVKHYPAGFGERCAVIGALRVTRAPKSFTVPAAAFVARSVNI